MTKRVWLILLVVVMMAMALTACATGGGEITLEQPATGAEQSSTSGEQPASGAQAPALANATDVAAGAAAAASSNDGTVQSSSGNVSVVDVTPMSEAELAAQGAGQTEPGGPAAEPGQTEGGTADGLTSTEGWQAYTDSTYGFSVDYPAGYEVEQANPSLFSTLAVPPAASIYIMNPTIAQSALAGTDAPDLEIRVHEAGEIASLESWLATVGLTSANAPAAEVYQGSTTSGLKVCESTMIVPNCSVFFAGNGRVYQLRPLNLEGETMVSTFRLTQ